MFARTICLDHLCAWAFWIVGAALTVGDWLRFTGEDSGFVGVALVVGGNILGMTAVMRRRGTAERAAFELGRDSVRPLR